MFLSKNIFNLTNNIETVINLTDNNSNFFLNLFNLSKINIQQ